MDFHQKVSILFIVLSCIYHSFGIPSAQDTVPTFDDKRSIHLAPPTNASNGQTYAQGVIKPKSNVSVTVDMKDVANASFLVLQVHSYIQPLVLFSIPNLQLAEHVNGTDIGLYVKLPSKALIVNFFIYNPNTVPVSVLVVPMVYQKGDPVPGGCNLSFSVNIAPYMSLSYDYEDNVVQVDAQAASLQDHSDCAPTGLDYEVYEVYSARTDTDSYFDTILSIVSAENAELIGIPSRKSIGRPQLRRRFAGYPGFGSVYVVTVRNTHTNKRAAYVPIANYHCIDESDGDCHDYKYALWIIVAVFVAFILAEMRFVLGRYSKLTFHSAFALGSFVMFVSSWPLYTTALIVFFFLVCVVVLYFWERPNQHYISFYHYVSMLMEAAFAFVAAHFLFGMFLPVLGKLPGFQDWATMLATFIALCLFFYLLFQLFPDHMIDQALGSLTLLTLLSYAFSGTFLYIYVDPARALRSELSDVFFYRPIFLSEWWWWCEWTILIVILSIGRNLSKHDESGDVTNAPLVSSQRSYMTM